MQKTASLIFMSSIATREALRELVPKFEQAHGCKVALEFAGGVDVVRRLKAGETGMDVVSLSASAIEELVQAGALAAGSRVDFASSTVGVAGRARGPPPEVGPGQAGEPAGAPAGAPPPSIGPN